MSMRAKSYALNGGHTAGIFADMSIDGPVIGTLVAVVDRAKNLPNRKTIGKQDPYCAARLGKEAKKTTTDVRGGQTPRWDQELRFTVHDSADYYQLKVSVFTDDKKTDLIGEAWVDLKSIIVAGGGQNDMWQTLTCKGKYAGEIRIEITFYDSRPKPEKPARAANSSEQDNASPKQKTPVKRRPLPSDPVTGEAPALPVSPPAQPSPLEHRQTPPRWQGNDGPQPGFVATQSPLQSVEYNTPPPASRQHPDHYPSQYSPSPQSAFATGRLDGPRPSHPSRESSSARTPSRHRDDRDHHHGHHVHSSPYERQHPPFPEHPHDAVTEDFREQPPLEDGAPPPPPAHRSSPAGGGQELVHRGSYDGSPQKSMQSVQMRQDVLRSEAHRHSSPAYPGQPVFRAHDPAPSSPYHPAPYGSTHEAASPRYPSYDGYDPPHRSMQPTVEDVPESPPGPMPNTYHRPVARMHSRDETVFETNPSAVPPNFGRSAGASSHPLSSTPGHHSSAWQNQNGHAGDGYDVSSRDYPNSPAHPQHNQDIHRPSPRRDFEPHHQLRSSPSYGPPDAPPSLSPGHDPALSHETPEQMYEESRTGGQHPLQLTTPTRGRRQWEGSPTYVTSPQSYSSHPHDHRSAVTYSGGPDNQVVVRRRAVSPSPNPLHTIRRKSVSPVPPPSDDRMASDVPFSPDSYDALNPAMASPREEQSAAHGRGHGQAEADEKIIMHDGREVDPSDHLPVESWAPEPLPKVQNEQPPAESRSRPSGAQPMPPSGRRPLRIATRPQSKTAALPPSYSFGDDARGAPLAAGAGRSRLQRRAHRGSTAPWAAPSSPLAPVSTDNYQERQGLYITTGGRDLHGGGSWGYPNENQAPYYGSRPPIPAKMPLPMMSGANGGGDVALVEEMQSIDLGAGRSRRKGGY
ncbi:hypothetical protein RJ55_03241 [Drechmeria coniospora]|nr:hypothetical protein RJ55_03241 [Drechmeria coniospora]